MDHHAHAGRHQRPDLADLGVADSDAAYRPVLRRMPDQELAPAIGLAMDVDVASGRNAQRRGVRLVVLVRIGDAKREVKSASWVTRIDHVRTFWRAAVAFAFLVAFGREAQCHAVSPDRLARALQFHPSLALEHLYQVGLRLSRRR